jgi:ribosomal protein S18 acetylase RimI-like enzyme
MDTRLSGGLEIRRVTPEWAAALARFFDELRAAGDETFFHPHPLTAEQAQAVAAHVGRDLYYVATGDARVLGYAMLRGWDEGYAIPSLGIALAPNARGIGLGQVLMHFLHAAARLRGAARVRLKVYSGNVRAVTLYRAFGYEFTPGGDAELVGLLDL